MQVDRSDERNSKPWRSGDRRFLAEIQRFAKRGRDVIVSVTGTSDIDESTDVRSGLLASAVACVQSSREKAQCLLIVPTVKGVEDLRAAAEPAAASRGRRDVTIAHLGTDDDLRAEATKVAAGPDVVVTTPRRLIDHIRRGNADLSRVSACVLSPPLDSTVASFGADLHFIYTKFEHEPSTIVFSGGNEDDLGEIVDLLHRPVSVPMRPSAGTDTSRARKPQQEYSDMAKRDLPFDPESTAQQLREIVRKIHEDEDPNVMNQYRKFIRRHVSVFSRGYFTAYLFKHFTGGESVSSSRKSIFVSAGRNRRVHARDLVTLFTSTDDVSRDDIGQIKVLDNYSFVEIEASKAKQAIEALNGTDFRGRKLTVNYARKK